MLRRVASETFIDDPALIEKVAIATRVAISDSLRGIRFSDADVERARLLRHYSLHQAAIMLTLRAVTWGSWA
jgi:hypothetical protein